MKKKHTTRGFFYPRVVLGFVFGAIGLFLALLGFGAFANAFAEPKASSRDSTGRFSTPPTRADSASDASRATSPVADQTVQDNAPFSAADENGRFVYLVEFVEPGLLQRQKRTPNARFKMNTPEAQALREQIMAEQAAHVKAMARAIDRTPKVTHHFVVTHSGLAIRLTAAEAQIVRKLPGVVSIERERLYKMDTYRGPAFIGANTIWDGSAVPGGVGTKGEGMVIAMLDGGVDSTHPSYSNVAFPDGNG